MASAQPIRIRRAENAPGGLTATAGSGADATSLHATTPGGSQFFGKTPGGSRIIYTREQLLNLASSPLAQSPPAPEKIHRSKIGGANGTLPALISRSPEKHHMASFGGTTTRGFGISPSDKRNNSRSSSGAAGAGQTAFGSGSFGRTPSGGIISGAPGASASAGAAPATSPISFQRKPSQSLAHSSSGGSGGNAEGSAGVASPTFSRSPGNAFNFSAPVRSVMTPAAASAGGTAPPGLSGPSSSSPANTRPADVDIHRKMSGLALGRPSGA
ncbi:hypothetical protein K437DRAFT_258073 [Tilletiaria anomala UBC 951]|uniref:Eukaryotic translation initiation factor 4E binding protein n=1 Tax=Tilletiaria anomala (strain ATCC 24038 / CBS 436.72 / UBC 951) TaxID=1037660 RepID=A0A066VT46_TILAU|nr:uncharacterized protein K437DRAFT_258073 [Tilletiaria anomala UBC 951]KDN41984.1 hypothetical protein K437DRAFT_258073 [Tilletiaria anomala UBC 951]